MKNGHGFAIPYAVWLILLGAWFLIAPGSVSHLLKWVIVIAIVLMALPPLVQGLRNRDDRFALSRGLGLLVAALVVFVLFQLLVSFVPLMLGILLVLYGINAIASARARKQYVNVSVVPSIAYGVLVTLVGIVLMFNPFGAILLTLRIVGGVMLVMGICEVLDGMRGRRA